MTLIVPNPFADRSDLYARHRPHYPEALFEWLRDQTPDHEAALDCATGNGQAAVALTRYYQRVVAMDVSAEQIAQAQSHPQVEYRVGQVEHSSLPTKTFDVVTVAQALHWFDFEPFWAQVRRVAKPGALFCAWGYNPTETDRELDVAFIEPFRRIIAPFWDPRNRILWNGYLTEEIKFPFTRLVVPSFAIEVDWAFSDVVDYFLTWSAYKQSRKDTVAAARMDELMLRAKGTFSQDRRFVIRMPLTMLAGFVR